MPNVVDYFEIGSPEPEKSRDFYSGLFDWNVGDPGPAQYRDIGHGSGGIWDTAAMGGTTYAIFYVHVDDVQTAIDKAVELGASVVIPLVDNGTITFAHLADPTGNRFGVWQPNSERG